MSTSHPCPLTQAFEVIHTEVRRLQRENGELRMKNNQKEAAITLVMGERDDLKKQVGQLRGMLRRKCGDAAVDGLIDQAVGA